MVTDISFSFSRGELMREWNRGQVLCDLNPGGRYLESHLSVKIRRAQCVLIRIRGMNQILCIGLRVFLSVLAWVPQPTCDDVLISLERTF